MSKFVKNAIFVTRILFNFSDFLRYFYIKFAFNMLLFTSKTKLWKIYWSIEIYWNVQVLFALSRNNCVTTEKILFMAISCTCLFWALCYNGCYYWQKLWVMEHMVVSLMVLMVIDVNLLKLKGFSVGIWVKNGLRWNSLEYFPFILAFTTDKSNY